jgi:N-acetyltransferase 10
MLRYAISDAAADWSIAETQVTNIARGTGNATIVSVKSNAPAEGRKRKADHGEDKQGSKDKKSTRRGGKKVKR